MYALNDLGWDSFFDQQLTSEDRQHGVPARVIWESRERYRLSTGEAEWQAELAGRLRHTAESRPDLPTVGDWVLAATQEGGRATIHRVLTRRSRFSRTAAGRATEEQIAAANVDTAFVVTSLNLDFNARRIERYLALIYESGARPAIILTKADLCGDPDRVRLEAGSVAPDVPILVTSVVTGTGVADLQDVARTAGTSALLGSSGVGKSALINALLGSDVQRLAPVREHDDRGRHATTSRQLFCLPRGGILIDTPGMRELRLWDAGEGLLRAFDDIEALAEGCRFRDCAHHSEPGCAVTLAVSEGRLPPERLDSYRRLQREEQFWQSRHDEGSRLERHRRERLLGKAQRDAYKKRGR